MRKMALAPRRRSRSAQIALGSLSTVLLLLAALILARPASADPGCVAGPHSGTLGFSQEWCATHSPHTVNGVVYIPNGITLTIQAGGAVQFGSGGVLVVQSGGTLIVAGAEAQPVSLTSTSGTPAPGAWRGLDLQGGSIAQLEYMELAYAGQTDGRSLRIMSSSVAIRHSHLHHGAGWGLLLEGVGIAPSLEDVEIAHCTGTALHQNTLDMTPSYVQVALHDNGGDYALINGATLSRDLTLDGSPAALGGAPIYLGGSSVAAGRTLTITAGSEIRLPSGGYLLVQSGGSLVAMGSASAPIRLTGQAASPGPGSWRRLDLQSGSRGRLAYVEIAYAGQSDGRSLGVFSSDVEMRHSRIHDGAGTGLHLEGAGLTPIFEDVEIDHGTGNAIYQTTVNMRPTYRALSLHDNAPDALAINCASFLAQAVTWDGPNLGGAPINVINSLILDAGATLTVTAGTTVRVGSGQVVQIRNGGALHIQGTAGQPVVFTSQAATPAPGGWVGIDVWQAGARLQAEHLDLGYAGQTNGRSLHITGSDVEVRDSRIHHGAGTGIRLPSTGLTPVLQRLEIDHNSGSAILQDRINLNPVYEDIWMHDNGLDSLELSNPDFLSTAVTLDAPASFRGAPVRLSLGVIVAAGGVLTVTPGTTLEFAPGRILQVRDGGRLYAQGEPTQPITFTSQYADKAPGQWGHLQFQNGSQGSVSYCDIGYGGGGSWDPLYNVRLEDSDVEIAHCQIHHSSGHGVHVENWEITPLLADNIIADNAWHGINIQTGCPVLVANRLERNGAYALYNNGWWNTCVVDARYQYWGHYSGPYHPVLNPSGLGGQVGEENVLFIPWLDASENTALPPELISPAAGETLTGLPLRFRMVSHDPDTWQSLYYGVEILQGGVRQRLYQQRASREGWDRAVYAPESAATLTPLDTLPDGAYTWRAAAFDGWQELWSEERPFTVTLGVAFAVTGVSPEEVLAGLNVSPTLKVRGLGFAGEPVQVRVERELWDGALEQLTPLNVQVLSDDQLAFDLDLTGVSGPWEVIVTRGTEEGHAPLTVYPYLPIFSLDYRNPGELAPGRWQEHTLVLENVGSADGVAIVGLRGPEGASFYLPPQPDIVYLGSPMERMHLVAARLAAGALASFNLEWQIPWDVVNPPGDPADPDRYDLGDPLRYRFAVVGQLSGEAWDALQAEAPGDLDQQVYLATWGAMLAEGLAADAYLEPANRALAGDYIERLGAVYPFIADALVYRQYEDFTLAMYDALGYSVPGPFGEELVGATAENGAVSEYLKRWLDRAVGDPWEFTKAFFTGFDDVILSGQSGAFLILEAEGLVDGLTFGLWRPNLGGETYAHINGLDPGAVGAGHFIGNVLSIPVGPGIGKAASKGFGSLLFRAHNALKPTEDIYLAWNKLKLTIAGNVGEPQRWGISVISKNRDLPLLHWGNNPRYGGFHWGIGWEGKRVPGDLLGRMQEELYGAGLHFYQGHMYVPDAFLTGVPFLHSIPGPALRQYFNLIKECTLADWRLMNADIGDYLFPPPPQDESLCNDGSQNMVASWDPNAIEGTPRLSHIRPSQQLGLTVHFENLITATLPAETITVTLPVHPNLEWDSLQLAGASYTATVRADPVARTVTWRFDGIQLPPNANPPEGEGWARLTVSPRADLTTTEQITVTAMIVFDANPPLWTNVLTYTIDLSGPEADLSLDELLLLGARMGVAAADEAGGSGVANYCLLYSRDGETWTTGPAREVMPPLESLLDTLDFGAVPAGHYWLRVHASDDVGNLGPASNIVEVDVPWGLRLPVIRREIR